ncbi:MAG: methylmalonyl-CoA mutase family protein, partial [Verrucomicrobia bacterium]|nr:methylmalonyl-CoA mutase family protein [Cytophagales bacterium]
MTNQIQKPSNHIRIVTSTSLFDGHDAAINIMRRVMQASGAEVIHLGHNRSVAEIVDCAIQEDVHAIAITSYQGGHIEFFKYMYDLLQERKAGHIKIFGGGGGTILPSEVEELHNYGITRLYSPDDGRTMGLQGMIDDLLEKCSPPAPEGGFLIGEPEESFDSAYIDSLLEKISSKNSSVIGRLITIAENATENEVSHLRSQINSMLSNQISNAKDLMVSPFGGQGAVVLGITGTGGSGKSSLVDELVRRFLATYPDKTLAIISVDPSKRKTGGALLGDRIRMNAIDDERVYMRSLATRQSNLALSKYVQDAIDICKTANYDLIIVETSGIGQSDTEITDHSDLSLYVMTSEYGAATQLEKIDMLDFADLIAINKFDKKGSLDALRDVRKQYKRNHNLWDTPDEEMPIFGTIASQFNDAGMNRLFEAVMQKIGEKSVWHTTAELMHLDTGTESKPVIPPERVRYLAEICETIADYTGFVANQSKIARQLYQLKGTIDLLRKNIGSETITFAEQSDKLVFAVKYIQDEPEYLKDLVELYNRLEEKLDRACKKLLFDWENTKSRYKAAKYQFQVRDKVIEQDLFTTSLSGTKIPKVSLPRYQDWGDILTWILTENAPGFFPFAAGVFPLKRENEDPTRMFAGEGSPERTNKRFHYVSQNMPAKRLSTAFD